MTDINNKIIQMIKENRSIKDIGSILNLSEKQVYLRIKQIINYGYQIKPIYSYNSDINYEIVKDFYNKEDNSIDIKMENTDKEFRCIVISDTHIGNVDSDIDLLKRIYEYASKNDINIILNCGDIIEGVYSTDRKSLNNIEAQIETIIKKHPYDKNINNFMIFGNHDYHSIHYDGLDISKTISNARYDIVPIGYGKGLVNIKEDRLLLSHELSVVDNPKIDYDHNIVLCGHGHMMKTKLYDKLYICIPTLSNVFPDKTKDVIPGFVDLKIEFGKNRFEFVEAKHMIITPKIYEIGQSKCRVKSIFKNNNYKDKWK